MHAGSGAQSRSTSSLSSSDEVSSEAQDLIESLTRISPIARTKAEQVLQHTWVCGGDEGRGEGDAGTLPAGQAWGTAAVSEDAEGVPAPLTGAHARLNRWYDEFLFQSMTARLAEMADG